MRFPIGNVTELLCGFWCLLLAAGRSIARSFVEDPIRSGGHPSIHPGREASGVRHMQTCVASRLAGSGTLTRSPGTCGRAAFHNKFY